ncbi:cardiolipin synthase [Candidatus Williamhamiltonella defendens]|uniref:cardiolipin synthase n=1 Tax=Candidatus Williamhamiltonella defendens TaxID=138072 RepID=UPI00130EE0A7|nr:cardiolipin synthase [Candidatus Hamiltonella defensa]
MNTFYTFISSIVLFGYWLLIAGITLRILIKRRGVPSAMAWLLVIYIFPLVGIMAYLSFGELNLGKARALRAKALWPLTTNALNQSKDARQLFFPSHSAVSEPLFQLCELRQGIGAMKAHQLELLTTNEQTLKRLIRDIKQARYDIKMVFYIWQVGGWVDEIAEALMAAARRGVNCRLMLDSAGSRAFFRSQYPTMMLNAGIHLVEALKVNVLRMFFRRMDLRQHRKIVLIDNYIVYTGSMNMVDTSHHTNKKNKVGPWIDLMTRMEGSIATAIGMVYACDWQMETSKHILSELSPHKIDLNEHDKSAGPLQVIASGPGFPEDIIHQALLTAVYSAREQLIMTTPYFVPSEDLLHAICTASQRGVEVIIILPYRSNSMIVSWASRAFFADLLKSKVKIYQFQGGMLHSKSVLVDKQLSLIGTVNLDMRSLWLNFEITVAIDDWDFGENLACLQNYYVKNSILLEKDQWEKRSVWQSIIERLFYFFSPFL